MENIQRPEQISNTPNQPIAAQIFIGVTGHRKLDSSPEMIDAIQVAIDMIKQMLPTLQNTQVVLTIVSPIAEGADRLVAREILKNPGSTLEVVLPLTKEDYKLDFQTAQSKAEFEELLLKASSVKTLPSSSSRTQAYEKVGHYIVNHCDVIIALWNGQPSAGQGGTQEIVQYARDINRPLIWINSDEPERVSLELGYGIRSKPFLDIDKYNSERFLTDKLD